MASGRVTAARIRLPYLRIGAHLRWRRSPGSPPALPMRLMQASQSLANRVHVLLHEVGEVFVGMPSLGRAVLDPSAASDRSPDRCERNPGLRPARGRRVPRGLAERPRRWIMLKLSETRMEGPVAEGKRRLVPIRLGRAGLGLSGPLFVWLRGQDVRGECGTRSPHLACR